MFDIFEKLILRTLLFREMMFMLKCFEKQSQSIMKLNIRREFIKTLHFPPPGRRGQKLFPVLKLPEVSLVISIILIKYKRYVLLVPAKASRWQHIHDYRLHRGDATDQSEIEIYR